MPAAPRKKIVRIIARLNVGGPAKHVAWLTAGLDNSVYESLLVTGQVPPGEEDMGYFAESLGVVPLCIPEMSREISLKDAVTIWKLFRLFRREQPDIVHTHTAKAGTVGRIAGLFYRWSTPAVLIGRPRECKFVHTYHGHIFHSYYGALKTRAFIFVEKFLAWAITDKLVVVSEQQRDEILNRFHIGRENQFKVVPLGLDLQVFHDPESRRSVLRRELGVDDETILIGIVGRLTEIKNHQLFLKAMAKFKTRLESSRPVRFVVIGDGLLRQSLESLASSLGLQDDVIFAGSRKDPENFYPALDVVALTSLNEGTPLTLIEAMANSRPVIATRVGGVVDLLGEACEEGAAQKCKRGVGVQHGDESAFALGLSRLVDDIELRRELGGNGFAFVSTNYGKDRLLSDINTLYENLLRPENAALETHSAERTLQSGV